MSPGVKVKPGHVTANLVLNRPLDVSKVIDALRSRRHVLVSGPSGSGKSALVWLATTSAAGQMRWYDQITGLATAADAEAIIRFVRARRPTEMSPIGLVFDEVGSANSDLWDSSPGEGVLHLRAAHRAGSRRARRAGRWNWGLRSAWSRTSTSSSSITSCCGRKTTWRSRCR